ncbi:MAG: 4Fe-4S dicluster domain-containing protein [Deltaproteobacteria bacterium]|nr:4Fe-4S dicluster domain-containing protein [Deltaproteobacteria bacterium]
MKILAKEKVQDFLRGMNREAQVYCPQRTENGDMLLLPLGDGTYTGEVGKAPFSAKTVLFPQTENLLLFGQGTITKITEHEKTIVFGVRPCDMRAIAFTDRFMRRDNLVDPHYFARRYAVTCIVVACNEPPSETCFCKATGGELFLTDIPHDVQLFDAGSYFIAMAGSERGKAILGNGFFDSAGEEDRQKLAAIEERAAHAGMATNGVQSATEKLLANKVDDSFWELLAERCIKCGGCTYVCPTCTCFNVYDYPGDAGYLRCRNWDACLFSGFTRETSGHNPRTTQGARLARRYEHKLKFDLMNYHETGCVGCGRCSDVCPVGLGAIEIIDAINKVQESRKR